MSGCGGAMENSRAKGLVLDRVHGTWSPSMYSRGERERAVKMRWGNQLQELANDTSPVVA